VKIIEDRCNDSMKLQEEIRSKHWKLAMSNVDIDALGLKSKEKRQVLRMRAALAANTGGETAGESWEEEETPSGIVEMEM